MIDSYKVKSLENYQMQIDYMIKLCLYFCRESG